MIVAALCGSLQIGLLDPICLFHRSMSMAIFPMLNLFFPSSVYVRQYFHAGAWVIGFLLLFLVGMNVVIPRFFCRVLCPLGAFLGTLSTAALWRIDRDPHKCVDCDLCLKSCEGASDPHTQLRKSECFVCFNCIEDCPEDAISFKFMPALQREITAPVVPARRAFLATLLGVAFFAFGRASGASDRNYDKKVIRPPGSVEEKDFLERCIKCDQCLRVCPTNVLQPALMESGLEGIWTPILNMKLGYCEVNCTLCGQVCPTGAIQRITIEEKTGTGTVCQRRPDPARHGLFRSWPLPAVVHGNPLRRLRGSLSRLAQGDLFARSHHYQARRQSHHAAPALRGPGAVHRLRHLRTRMSRHRRSRHPRHRRGRNPLARPPPADGRRRHQRSPEPGRQAAVKIWSFARPPARKSYRCTDGAEKNADKARSSAIGLRASDFELTLAMEKVTSGQRPRTCRACGKKFEYPVKGSEATRHHCADCVALPPDVRKILERLNPAWPSLKTSCAGSRKKRPTKRRAIDSKSVIVTIQKSPRLMF